MRTLLAILLLAASSFCQEPAAEHQLFFTAISRDASQPALEAESLETKGVQTVTKLERLADCPLAVAIVFDDSASGNETYKAQQLAASEVIKRLFRPSIDQAIFVRFDNKPLVQVDWTRDSGELLREAHAGEAGGGSAVFSALKLAAVKLQSSTPANLPKVILLFSDVEDNHSTDTREQAMEALWNAGVRVYVFTFEHNSAVLAAGIIRESVSKNTGGRTIVLGINKQSIHFGGELETMQKELRNWYRLTYVPAENPHAKRKPEPLELKSKIPNLKISAPFAAIPTVVH